MKGTNQMMPPKAAEVLLKMGVTSIDITEEHLECSGFTYLNVYAGDSKAVLDGEFSIEELAAIEVWMKNPKGVYEAYKELIK